MGISIEQYRASIGMWSARRVKCSQASHDSTEPEYPDPVWSDDRPVLRGPWKLHALLLCVALVTLCLMQPCPTAACHNALPPVQCNSHKNVSLYAPQDTDFRQNSIINHQCLNALLIIGGVEQNPGPTLSADIIEEHNEVTAGLCAEAPAYIQDLLQHRKQLFMALTETWLKDHLDAELAVEGYTIFRQDCIRQKAHVRGRNYGGVALYIRDDIATSAEPVLQYSNGSVDVLGLHLRTANLMLIVLYRQPDNPASGQRSTSREFSQALDKINSTLTELPTPNPDIVLCGDFNLPHLTWTGGMMTMNTGTPAEENLMASRLQELTNEHFMYQQISGPTHRMGNTLDLCFSNNPVSSTATSAAQQCSPIITLSKAAQHTTLLVKRETLSAIHIHQMDQEQLLTHSISSVKK